MRRSLAQSRGVLADDELVSFLINANGSQVTVKDNLTIIAADATRHHTQNLSLVRVAFAAGNDFPHSIFLTAPGQKSETVFVFRDIQTGPSLSKLNPAEIDLSDDEVHEVN